MDASDIQSLIEEKVPVADFLGLEVEVVEPGHARFRMPFSPRIKNHLDIVYAGAIFALAEIAGGVAMLSAFKQDSCTVLTRRVEIDYVRPSRSDLLCEVTVPDTDVAENMAAVEADGRADVVLPIEVQDDRGRIVARVSAFYYLRQK
ncbi:MAG: PaaI family thioesterase [Anaerolineae bacterium]|nr:PaaI family thioesterase [Anaerolineae bacterium]